MVNHLSTFDEMPEGNDRPESFLADAIEAFRACEKRSFKRVPDGKFPDPDPEKDVPMPLENYKGMLREADIEDLLLNQLEQRKNQMISWIKNADNKALENKYYSGQKLCLAFMPLLLGNEPSVRLYQLHVMGEGLTNGFTPDPAYYFRLLPQEIQQACTFNVPFWGITFADSLRGLPFATDDQRKELIERVSNAFDNLKNLLS